MDRETNRKAGRTRRSFLVTATSAALGAAVADLTWPFAGSTAVAASAAASAQLAVGSPPLHDADYWAFADWLQPAMDQIWSDAETAYTHDARINASALVTHAVAALRGT